MLYQSLDLRISEWDAAAKSASVEVLRSPAGEVAPRRVKIDIDPDEQGQRLLYTADHGRHLGQLLWESLFSEDIRDIWGRSYQAALGRRRGLRLRLHIDDPHLAEIPWELLYDPAKQDHLVYDRNVSVVRYARIPSPAPEPISTERLSILVVAASPQDLPSLDWEHEVSLLQAALQELRAQDRVSLTVCAHATAQSLQDRLLETMPEAVHYIGHGEYDALTQSGALILEDAHGRSAPLDARAVARLLCRYRTQLAFLNACDTARGQRMGLAAALMRGDMPAVVAMQWPVEDQAAMHFARSFYRGVSHDLTMDECMTEGRLAISSTGGEPADWAAPVLYMRSLTGHLWVREAAPQPEAKVGEMAVGQEAAPTPVFQTSGPLRARRDSGLVLRRTEMQRLLKIARQPAIAEYVAILGSQYTGKTTLLMQLKQELREQTCLYVDLALLHQADLATCFRHLAFEFATQIEAGLCRQRDLVLQGARTRPWRDCNALSKVLADREANRLSTAVDFIGVLQLLAEASPAARITLLLDQVDALQDEVIEGLLSAFRAVLTQARRSDGPLAKYLLIVTGGLSLQHVGARRNAALQMMERVFLQDLDELQIAGILSTFARRDVPVEPDAAAQVLALTGGHPYLTMRLCAWMSHMEAPRIDHQAVADATANLMAADEHLDETLRRIAAEPAADAKLRQILAGARFRFSRSDPALATLELIGVIAPRTPVQVRNPIYEQVLREYVLGKRRPASASVSPASSAPQTRRLTARRQLQRLLAAVEQGTSASDDGAWRSFAAGLYAQVEGISVSPRSLVFERSFALILDIDEDADAATWRRYRPGALVVSRDLSAVSPERLVDEAVAQAHTLGLTLVLAMTHGGDWRRAEASISGPHQEVTIVHVPREQVAEVVHDGTTIAAFLNERFALAINPTP